MGGGITQEVLKMEQITIKGKIEFCDRGYQQYNREFTAILRDSAAFAYGNKTAVDILWGVMANGKKPEADLLIDTRYDKSIKRNEADFKKWVQTYFCNCLVEHVLTFY